ncbi:hypothetical protein SHJG_p1136 (plasmid) [Streptomyces hygroscopicus subsp. jinggangensis 5008]|nr:hypothetical protein SHJG_p1136 [Streptomyces hygroscopicus subsp. jinggangensis 5008]AGF68421.1 hypothetical protein SHJGH_p1136 [Streptomyces hygroscopicus subsp. jinggangensis TL01]
MVGQGFGSRAAQELRLVDVVQAAGQGPAAMPSPPISGSAAADRNSAPTTLSRIPGRDPRGTCSGYRRTEELLAAGRTGGHSRPECQDR